MPAGHHADSTVSLQVLGPMKSADDPARSSSAHVVLEAMAAYLTSTELQWEYADPT